MFKGYRVYGNDNTHIVLTDKARAYYDGEEILQIREYEMREENPKTDALESRYEYAYTFGAWPESRHMTETELNDALEGMADSSVDTDIDDD